MGIYDRIQSGTAQRAAHHSLDVDRGVARTHNADRYFRAVTTPRSLAPRMPITRAGGRVTEISVPEEMMLS